MLIDLKVLNGNLELDFNEYTYIYTVTVKEDIESLQLDYKLAEECSINIRNNNLNSYENIVYLDVYNVDNEITYTLYVYKENSNTVNSIDNYMQSLEVDNKEQINIMNLQFLGVGVFLALIIIFSIIFRRNKSQR